MDEGMLFFVAAGIFVAGAVGFSMIRKARRDAAAQNWPEAEATIQTAAIEPVSMGRGYSDLPCFAFSYLVAGEYYSGRFALWAKGGRSDELLRELIESKFTIRYDPDHPSSFFIPDETLGGCEVYLLPDN